MTKKKDIIINKDEKEKAGLMDIAEIKKHIKPCSFSGLNREDCPVFRVLRKETVSPRAKVLFIKNENLTNRAEIFYKYCCLCGLCCKRFCFSDMKYLIRKVREYLVENNIETRLNHNIAENIKVHGKPYGDRKKIRDLDEFFGLK